MANTMGHGGTTRVAAALVVVSLLVLDTTAVPSMRRSMFADTVSRRGLLDSTDEPRTIAVDLMDIQHVDSPYRQPNLTVSERVQISVANSKRRSLAGTLGFTSPLQSTQEAYIMQITVGTPPRTFVAIADTASDLVWLQCTPNNCTSDDCIETPDQPFDPTASSSYTSIACSDPFCADLQYFELECPSTNVCEFNYGYADLTFTIGSLAYETFTFTETDGKAGAVSNVAFGCGFDDESDTFYATDGLVGLGQGPLSLSSQLIARNITSPVFSYCLVAYDSATTVTSPLVFGSAGAAEKIYTPLLSNPNMSTFYYVSLLGITVNGKAVDIPDGTFDIDPTTGEGGIILSSGNTVSSLYDAAYTPLESAVASHITYPSAGLSETGFTLCYDLSDVESPVFPTVTFQFDGVDLTLGSNNTFLVVDDVGTTCFAILTAGSNSTLSVFGNIQQSNFEIAYDIGNQRIGFAAAQC